MPEAVDTARLENLGPAERIINTLLTYSDHIYHGRPGIVMADRAQPSGVRWHPVTTKVENDEVIVYQRVRVGKKDNLLRLGVLGKDKQIRDGQKIVGRFQKPGLFPEAAVWMYSQVASIYALDNEFVARWASYAYKEEHRDLKLILAAFLLVQNRFGKPVKKDDKVLFYDEDYRDVGKAMLLLESKTNLDAKMIYRVFKLLRLPAIAEINRKLGFGESKRRAPMGRYEHAVRQWLKRREQNSHLLKGLVKAGYGKTVIRLSSQVGYKPTSPDFFQVLRWEQKQSPQGHRELGIGDEVKAAEDWSNLTEAEICERITNTKPDFKRIVGLLPKKIGLTRAIVAASIEAKSMSNKDLIIYSPTLEQLGLLKVDFIRQRWEKAIQASEDMRASKIALKLEDKDNADKLVEASDNAKKKALEEALKGLYIYVAVDISGSMENAIERAKTYIISLLQGFPLDKVVVGVFNTTARRINIKTSDAMSVEQAFYGLRAGGGTDHGSVFRMVFQNYPTPPDHDALVLWVGDQGQNGSCMNAIRDSGIPVTAFGLLDVSRGQGYGMKHIELTASNLGIPCFPIDENMFTHDDPYAVLRTLRNLILSTPVGQAAKPTAPRARRKTLVEQILETPLLASPTWAN